MHYSTGKKEREKKFVFENCHVLLFRCSHHDQLKKLRDLIPNYQPQQDLKQDFTKLSFYHFDGNNK